MPFIPQNFKDGVGPPISAAWLNQLDQLANNALQSATTIAALQAILGINSPFVASQLANLQLLSTVLTNTGLALTLPTGKYVIDMLLNFNGTITGAQGIQFNAAGTAAFAASVLGAFSGKVNGAGISSTWNLNQNFPVIDIANVVDTVMVRTGISVTAAGTFIIQAAQNSANANATNLTGYLVATKTN